MTKQDIYEIVDISEPGEFEYYENISDLLECEEPYDVNALAEFISELNSDTFAGLIDDYFKVLNKTLPEDNSEVLELFVNIRRVLVGLARNIEDDSTYIKLAEELDKFHNYFILEEKVNAFDRKANKNYKISVFAATVEIMLANIQGETLELDFTNALDYELDEYVMSFGDMISLAEAEDDDTEF